MLPRFAVAATLLVLAAGAGAQTDPGVVDANTLAARRIAAREAGRDAINADAQALYADDMAAYRQEVEANQQAIAQDQDRYDHEQRAYADAMRAWRSQVYDCKHGHTDACRAPTPRPADFW